VSVIGGGARSRFWGRILASVLNRPLRYHTGAETGPAFGAARLARLATSGEDPSRVCVAPPVAAIVEPEPTLLGRYADRLAIYRRLYRELRVTFAATSVPP
jgi:xylulokinase